MLAYKQSQNQGCFFFMIRSNSVTCRAFLLEGMKGDEVDGAVVLGEGAHLRLPVHGAL